ncbi:hypothetical protein DFQ27_003381 [Actinomortierella ambigua]|uniref:Superoxide dismutase copper/zinc binding domain-containing protein n=1 Tax=Actinomortierella ambigua TaxID=1343610 RepID=A0A9P6QKH8_9FUNG|nr:hypothetical protein DFQ27_003381 [Actinomortierella ambigua]
MQFKNLVAALAIAGLATAQTPAAAPTKGSAHINMADIDATISFEKVATGVNVTVTVAKGLTTALQVLPSGFQYHIHEKPVGPNNNCTATGGHQNPTKVNYNTAPCDPKNLASCEVGDLAGKHGNLNGTADGKVASFSYIDTQITFDGDNSIVGRSVVIHNNVTRIACADIVTGAATGGNNTTGGGNTGGDKDKSSATKLAGSLVLSSMVALMMFAF